MTKQQLAVLESQAGVKRVIACAGSGKTLVLTQSIIDILKNGLCRPDEILAITFTKNAAENMRQSIKKAVKEKIDFESINIFTFNAFGNYIICENSFILGLGKDYKLINIPKSWQILYEIIKSHHFKNITIGKDISKFINGVLNYIWSLKANLINLDDLKDYISYYRQIVSEFKSKALQNEELEIAEYQYDLMRIYSSYEEIKRQNNFIDYHDHVFLPYVLLLSDKKLSSVYKNRFKFIFVDEFQDSDIAQGYLISLLYNPGFNNLMIVGDDDQGIYSFRGACVENILRFNYWDIFSDYEVTDFFLTTNFRSGLNIVKAIDAVIGVNENRFTKDLEPEFSQKYSEVLFFSCKTHEKEADEIIKNIRVLLESGLMLKDIAILARRKRFKNITGALDKNNLKFELISSKGFFYEPEVLFIISWLMAINDINSEIYLLYLLQSLKYKLSDRDLFFLKKFDYSNGLLFNNWENSNFNLLDGIINYSINPYLSTEAKKRLKEFLTEFNFYLGQAGFLRLSELISLIFSHSGLSDELRSSFDKSAKIKIKNVETLIKISSDFELEQSGYSLDSFIAYLKDVAKTEEEDPDKIYFSSSNSIKIMTIHAAKGLEFEAVFMPMLWKKDYFSRTASEKFKIPSLLRKDRVIYRQKGSFKSKQKYDDEIKKLGIEEERRIFYVGCSRAKKYLFLSSSSYENEMEQKNDKKKPREVLPFLVDILKNDFVKPLNMEGVDFIKTIAGKDFEGRVAGLEELIFDFVGKKEKKDNVDIVKKYEIFNSGILKNVEKILVKNLKKIKTPVFYNIDSSGKCKSHINLKIEKKIEKEDQYNLKRYFSLTELLDYINCPRYYMWKYLYNIPDSPSKKIDIGEKVHKIIELITMSKYENLVSNNIIQSDSLTKKGILKQEVFITGSSFINCEDSLKNYVYAYTESKFFNFDDIKLIILEKLFYWNLQELIVSSKVDRLDFKNDGSLRIIDYKVSGFSRNYENKGYINQLKSYTAGISSIFNINPERISSFLLYLDGGKESEFSFRYDEIKEFEENLLCTAKAINSRDFKLKDRKKCGKICTYSRMCHL